MHAEQDSVVSTMLIETPCTAAMRFVDTNVLVYAVCTTGEDVVKFEQARRLLQERDLALSAQVLQEFYVQATRPSRPGALTHTEAVSFAMAMRRFRVQEVSLSVVEDAFALRGRFGLSYWDCAILAASRACGCNTVYSEDLSDTQDYDGIRVVNPFK